MSFQELPSDEKGFLKSFLTRRNFMLKKALGIFLFRFATGWTWARNRSEIDSTDKRFDSKKLRKSLAVNWKHIFSNVLDFDPSDSLVDDSTRCSIICLLVPFFGNFLPPSNWNRFVIKWRMFIGDAAGVGRGSETWFHGFVFPLRGSEILKWWKNARLQ